jgi:CBS domain-containing protein
MSWVVADVMTRDVVAIEADEDFKTCVRLLNRHRISALPVVEHATRRLIGVVSESDLLAKERGRDSAPPLGPARWLADQVAAARTASDLMTSPAIAIGPEARLPDAARLMYRKGVKRLPVVDGEGRLVGILSRADLLKTFMRSDELIRNDVREDLLRKSLFIEPSAVDVQVDGGLVRIAGELETKSLADLVVRMIGRIEGTVGVESRLTWKFDDTRLHVEEPAGSLQLSAQERAPR